MKTILLIEDYGDLKKALEDSLLKEAWKIIVPEESTGSFRWILEMIPDLVIADINSMSDSKVELLLYLNSEFFSTIPFLLITANRKILGSEFSKGYKYYLIRPYKKWQLINTVKEILKHTEIKNPW